MPSKLAVDILNDTDLIRREILRVRVANGAHVLPRDTSYLMAWLDHIEWCAHQLNSSTLPQKDR